MLLKRWFGTLQSFRKLIVMMSQPSLNFLEVALQFGDNQQLTVALGTETKLFCSPVSVEKL